MRITTATIGLLTGAALFAACGALSGGSGSAAPAGEEVAATSAEPGADATGDGESSLLFALHGDAGIEGGRLVLADTDRAIWFTDRPGRDAGSITVTGLVALWDDVGFAEDPPNAALLAGDAGTVLELTDPVAPEGGGVSFAFRPVGPTNDGPAPTDGPLGPVDLFIDDATLPPAPDGDAGRGTTEAAELAMSRFRSYSIGSLYDSAADVFNQSLSELQSRWNAITEQADEVEGEG